MRVSIELPLDNGFLRRECPACQGEFKWHHGPSPNRPGDAVDPAVYFCPYCGGTAPPNSWWTKEQLSYAKQLALGPVVQAYGDALENAIGKQSSASLIKIEVNRGDIPEPPPELYEPSDMTMIRSPCHPWEPIKISENWSGPLYCLICGEKYAV
jgi:hypothetical protein